MRRLWDAFLSLVYPPRCYGCQTSTQRPAFCGNCCIAIITPRSPLCSRCGIPFNTSGDTDHVCSRCRQHPPYFGRARACAIYDSAADAADPVKAVLQRYKYNRDVSLVRPLGDLLVQRTPLDVGSYDVIMPVPLHIDRLRWRGFNQAHFLACRLARARRVRVDPFSLRRVRSTAPQVNLNDRDRWRNVARAFHVTRPQRVRGRKVLLFDDVLTTGATANECSRTLRRAGARSVDVLVLARAVLR